MNKKRKRPDNKDAESRFIEKHMLSKNCKPSYDICGLDLASSLKEYSIFILYQSLEFPKNKYTKKLTTTLSNLSKKLNMELTDSSDIDRGKPLYDQYIDLLLNTYLSHLEIEPDVIVLGEYTNSKLVIKNYSCAISIPSKGVRGMTILCKNRLKELIKINPDTKSSITKDIGEYIKIEYEDRSLIMAHVLNGKKEKTPENRIQNVIKSKINTFIIGDLNFNLKSDDHQATKILNTHSNVLVKNTDSTNLFNKSLFKFRNTFYEKLQQTLNIPGKTTYSTAHDGACDKYMINTDLKIIGSIWPIIDPSVAIVKKTKLDGKYILMSDHKGCLIKFTVNNFNKHGTKVNIN